MAGLRGDQMSTESKQHVRAFLEFDAQQLHCKHIYAGTIVKTQPRETQSRIKILGNAGRVSTWQQFANALLNVNAESRLLYNNVLALQADLQPCLSMENIDVIKVQSLCLAIHANINSIIASMKCRSAALPAQVNVQHMQSLLGNGTLMQQNLKHFGTLKQIRAQLVQDIAKPKHDVPVFLSRRLAYVGLNAVDAALERCVNAMISVKQEDYPVDLVRFGKFHVHQIMAGAVHDHAVTQNLSDIKTQALDLMHTLENISSSIVPMGGNNLSVCSQHMLRNLLLASASAGQPCVWPRSMGLYQRYDLSTDEMCEVRLQTDRDCRVNSMMQQQLQADLQHRIISPLVHHHVMCLLSTNASGSQITAQKEEVIGMFHEHLQPWARLALLGGDAQEANSDIWWFLDHPEKVGTGYNANKMQTFVLNQLWSGDMPES